jgi:hypothetical protein
MFSQVTETASLQLNSEHYSIPYLQFTSAFDDKVPPCAGELRVSGAYATIALPSRGQFSFGWCLLSKNHGAGIW